MDLSLLLYNKGIRSEVVTAFLIACLWLPLGLFLRKGLTEPG